MVCLLNGHTVRHHVAWIVGRAVGHQGRGNRISLATLKGHCHWSAEPAGMAIVTPLLQTVCSRGEKLFPDVTSG